ncbi:unnamed protein product [Protopolystoma xenopodis]|uniref:Uncharacterized protein n=1 Tax=Protopolystoma xenopodis TaxID=117903 RepID=A0A3S5ACJ0_9PLAT|nr:unnamed protein product [Protopolystoma xenopodis]
MWLCRRRRIFLKTKSQATCPKNRRVGRCKVVRRLALVLASSTSPRPWSSVHVARGPRPAVRPRRRSDWSSPPLH